jgi:adenylate kinase family enzyme
MSNTSNINRPWTKKTRVVEIVGPAGAGKTTLCRALACHTEAIRLENFPDVRKAADAPFFISNGLQLIPSLLRHYRPKSRNLTRREFAWMTILNGWSALLRKEANEGSKVIILDQGPLYLLAEMRLFGPEYLRQRTAERLWQDFYDRWKDTLYLVVWLDADNDILLDRIRTRKQDHIVKAQPAAVVHEFLNRYRTEYESILSILTGKEASLRVLKFDTGRQQSQDIENQFLSKLSC